MIKNTSHCLICENSKRDKMSGIYCGVTNEKPKFLNKCPIIKFGDLIEKKITEVNTAIKLVEITKKRTVFDSIIYFSFSCLTLIFSWGYTAKMHEIGVESSITWYTLTIGIALFIISFKKIYGYKKNLKLTQNNKVELDNLLKIYHYSYDIDISIKKAPHDTLDIETNLKIHKK